MIDLQEKNIALQIEKTDLMKKLIRYTVTPKFPASIILSLKWSNSYIAEMAFNFISIIPLFKEERLLYLLLNSFLLFICEFISPQIYDY